VEVVVVVVVAVVSVAVAAAAVAEAAVVAVAVIDAKNQVISHVIVQNQIHVAIYNNKVMKKIIR
jgi:hypothetical protein